MQYKPNGSKILRTALDKQFEVGDTVFVEVRSYKQRDGQTKAKLSMLEVDQQTGTLMSAHEARCSRRSQLQAPCVDSHDDRWKHGDAYDSEPRRSKGADTASQGRGDFIRIHNSKHCDFQRSGEQGTTHPSVAPVPTSAF